MLRILDAASVSRLATVDLALAAMRRCFRLEGERRGGAAGRIDVPHSSGWMRVLPAVVEGLGVFGHKTISFHREVGVRYAVTVYDLATGALLALVDAEEITGLRTGATAAVAADLLCRRDVERAAIVGTGSVARSQLPALQAVRPAREISVFSRDPDNRAAFIAEMQPVIDARLLDCERLEDALEGAALVTLATKSPVPVLSSLHVVPGVHVNSVGSARPDLSEVDPGAFAAFDRVVCDSVDLVFTEAGDAVAAADAGYDASRAVPLGDVVTGRSPGRTDPGEMTLFKSTGTGRQDLAMAVVLLAAAESAGEGTAIDDPLAVKRFGPGGRT